MKCIWRRSIEGLLAIIEAIPAHVSGRSINKGLRGAGEVETTEDATEEEITNDIFAIALEELRKSNTLDFCENFFNSEHVDLMNKCKTEAETLIPEDIDNLSDVFEMINIDGTNEYRAIVDYNDGNEGYVFNFSVVKEDGRYKIDSFTFESMESLYALTVSEIEDRYVEYFADLLDYSFSKGGLISDYFLIR